MQYLCRLVTQPGGTVLDPFMGSGSTGKAATLEGFNFVGMDLNPDYFEIAKARIAHAELIAKEDNSKDNSDMDTEDVEDALNVLFTGED